MEELRPEVVERMSASEFYQFLHDKYFVWKYTAKNRLATTRSHLRKYLDGDQLHRLEQIHNQIVSTSDIQEIEFGLEIKEGYTTIDEPALTLVLGESA